MLEMKCLDLTVIIFLEIPGVQGLVYENICLMSTHLFLSVNWPCFRTFIKFHTTFFKLKQISYTGNIFSKVLKMLSPFKFLFTFQGLNKIMTSRFTYNIPKYSNCVQKIFMLSKLNLGCKPVFGSVSSVTDGFISY